MKVIYSTGPVRPALTDTVAAIGIFDGVHTGHQALIRRMVRTARSDNKKSVVITFHPHPFEVLQKKEFSYLLSLEQRIKFIEKLGVDIMVVVRFTRKFSRLKPEEFVGSYLVDSLGVKKVYVGDDFRFGENRSGDVDLFETMGRRYGFVVRHIHPIKSSAYKISSSWLKNLIMTGKLQDATRMMGRNISVTGKVVRGKGLGTKIGIPTANIKLTSGIMPYNGVYLVSLFLDGRSLPGVCNIGHRPTINGKSLEVQLEVHLLNFNKQIYGKSVIVEFHKKIRNEKKFPTIDLLVKQIHGDVNRARKYFKFPAK